MSEGLYRADRDYGAQHRLYKRAVDAGYRTNDTPYQPGLRLAPTSGTTITPYAIGCQLVAVARLYSAIKYCLVCVA